MRAARALAAAVVLAAAAVVLPASTASALTRPAAVVVPPDGSTAATPFATRAWTPYRVTVTGAYSYNGRQNLADCGWWNPESAGDAWFRGGFLKLDGSSAACAAMPYTTTHTYTWVEWGTGAPFTFRVDDANPYDNVGALAVNVVEETTSGEVDGTCGTSPQVQDTEFDVVAVNVTMRVTASGDPGAASLQGRCRIVGAAGTVADVYAWGVSPAAAGADVVVLPLGSYQVCESGSAYWFLDGVFASFGERCRPL